uniref:Uncharacterized protein n=1 Tax=Anguilla anguilla TaxID=7936 RepID=A0A0E9Q782_ANGAN
MRSYFKSSFKLIALKEQLKCEHPGWSTELEREVINCLIGLSSSVILGFNSALQR